MSRKTLLQVMLALGVLLVLTLLIAAFKLDLITSALFFSPGQGFALGSMEPWHTLYAYGEIPALLLVGSALTTFLAGFFLPGYRSLRRASLFLILLYLIGPGLVVNALLKDHWGRERPVQISTFGGSQPFTEPWQKRDSAGKSFPSGHASVAFYLIAPAFLFRHKQKRTASLWLLTGSTFGLAVGTARIIQGGHFLSDVLWSGGLIYLLALILADLMHLDDGTRILFPSGWQLPRTRKYPIEQTVRIP